MAVQKPLEANSLSKLKLYKVKKTKTVQSTRVKESKVQCSVIVHTQYFGIPLCAKEIFIFQGLIKNSMQTTI